MNDYYKASLTLRNFNQNQSINSDKNYTGYIVYELINANNDKPLAPNLSAPLGTTTMRMFDIIAEGTYADGDLSNVSGWELYQKEGNNYILIDEAESAWPIKVDISYDCRPYLARVYKIDRNGYKIYSDYSNEYYVNSFCEYDDSVAPDLSQYNVGVMEDGRQIYDFAINILDESYSGWELYEVNNGQYTLTDDATIGGAAVAFMESGTTKTFIARAYKINSSGTKEYTKYSNEVVIQQD